MISHITACILALAVMRTTPSGKPVYHRQFRLEDAKTRAEFLAASINEIGRMYDIDPYLIMALAWHEAAFDRSRVSSVGARSIMQLTGRMGHAYDRACAMAGHAWACDWIAVAIATRELSVGTAQCGSEVGAISWYRSGTCRLTETWRVRQVLATRDELRWSAP